MESHPAEIVQGWILYWLSKHPSWRKWTPTSIHSFSQVYADEARAVQVTTRTFGVPADGVTTPQQLNRKGAARTMSYMPSTQAKHYMWYKGVFTAIRRQYHLEDYGIRRESLHIRFHSSSRRCIAADASV